ncbi:uncharacterized protein V6R79_000552 [Siganus canaliculatus]
MVAHTNLNVTSVQHAFLMALLFNTKHRQQCLPYIYSTETPALDGKLCVRACICVGIQTTGNTLIQLSRRDVLEFRVLTSPSTVDHTSVSGFRAAFEWGRVGGVDGKGLPPSADGSAPVPVWSPEARED